MLKCFSSLACFLIAGWLFGNGIVAGIATLVHVCMCVYKPCMLH